MSLVRPNLKQLRRASGQEAGLVTPQAWNALVDYCESMQKRMDALTPQSSPDIAVNHTAHGFTSHLKRRGAPGGGVAALKPLAASFIVESEVVKMTVLGCWLQNSVTGSFIEIAPITTPATGKFAYLKIVMDEAVAMVGTPTIVVEGTERLTPFETATETGPPAFDYVDEAYVPIASVEEIPDTAPVEYRLIQHLNGNLRLSHQAPSGFVVLWPETVSGSIPP